MIQNFSSFRNLNRKISDFFIDLSLPVNSVGTPATKTLRVVVKCKPLADKFVRIFADWIKRQPGEVSQYADMFRRVSYFRFVLPAFTNDKVVLGVPSMIIYFK